jgi:hypothetical protein
MSEGNLYTLMTEDELSTALARLHSMPAGRPDLAKARQELAAALEQPLPEPIRQGRHWGRWASAAAVVAVLVTGALVAENVVGGDQPAASAAALTLTQAASAAIHEQDPVLAPGQFLYTSLDDWSSMTYDGADSRPVYAYDAQWVLETWVPADQKDLWMRRTTPTGRQHVIMGTAAAAKALGMDVTSPLSSRTSVAPCGAFPTDPGQRKVSCADARTPGWPTPTPAWLAGLPTTAQGMLDRLRKDSGATEPGQDDEILTTADEALSSGLVPGKIRAVVYQALALLPELRITDQVANVDGRVGVAIGLDGQRGDDVHELIVDPATGQFIGDRQVTTSARSGIPSGTILSYTGVSTSVVDRLGALPAK